MASIQTIAQMFQAAAARHADRPMLRAKVRGQWRAEPFSRWQDDATAWARGLVALGLLPGDRVALLAPTSPHWVKADMAVALAGGVSVPIYPSLPGADIRHIAHHSGARFAFCADPALFRVLATSDEPVGALQHVICFADEATTDDGRLGIHDVAPDRAGWAMSVQTLAKAGRLLEADALTRRQAEIDPDDPSTFVYTSGTTGPQKGVVLSHRALVFEAQALVALLELRDDDRVLLLLPLAHIFERIVCYVCMLRGVELIFPTSLQTLIDDMQQTRPTVVPSVPKVFETVHRSAQTRARRGGPIATQSFGWALSIGRQIAALERKGKPTPRWLHVRHLAARGLVLDRLRQRLGGEVRFCISGGAPLSPEVSDFFSSFGLPVIEGYGLTETSAAATLQRLGDRRPGTVGQALPGTQVRIAADGEVLLRGPNLMTGYHDEPDATVAAFDADGWLRSGDLGELDSDGHLRITGRKKDLIVTAAGKNIAPQNVEQHLCSHPLIAQAFVHGDGRDFLTALITVDEQQLQAWAGEQGMPWSNYAEVTQRPEVFKLAQEAVDSVNRGLAGYETIKKFAVLDRPLRPETGDLTPTLKIRRQALAEKYADLLDSFYRDSY